MTRFFAEHPTAANVLMVVIILLGLAILPNLNRETFPEIANRNVAITVPYPGASPLEVEEGICNPLEDATDGVNYLEEQVCVARENVGVLTVKMKESGDIRSFIDDVKSAADGITNFPENAEDPIVKHLGQTQPVVTVAVSADITPSELKSLAEYYRNELLATPGIPMVEVSGFSTHEFKVQLQADALGQYQLSIDSIAKLIQQQALDLPVGTIKSNETEYQIRFENARRSVMELADLVILTNDDSGEIRLGDIATITDSFSEQALRTEINGRPTALLNISKNSSDDTLRVFNAVSDFVEFENQRLPESTRLIITQDSASIVQDRLNLLLTNGWQGLLLAALALMLFFNWRYTLWVALGLPISFLGGLVIVSALGVSINMISMVALLMAIGILMDDAIVISESIANEYGKGKSPLEAAATGVNKVWKGVLSSFATSVLLFGSLLFLKGDMGQVMRVLPIVLLAVLSVSLIEAFLILPHHLKHSLEKHHDEQPAKWRAWVEGNFEKLRNRVGLVADTAIQFRYAVVGGAIGLLILSVAMIPAGVLKFTFFPSLEGNTLESRVLMPQGTPFTHTENVINTLLLSLNRTLDELPAEPQGSLVKNIQISFSKNADAGEDGPHLATISLDLLEAETRNNSLNELRRQWIANTPQTPEAISIQFKEPSIGPQGQAISIRLQGNDLDTLSQASWDLQNWLNGYSGVSNVMDDLRPGKPQFAISLLPGGLSSGLNSQSLASQLRAAYQGTTVSEVYQGRESFEINVMLAESRDTALADLERLTIFSDIGISIPLSAIAEITEQREYASVKRVNHFRTVTISGDIDTELANTNEIISDVRESYFPTLHKDYPNIRISLEGEVKNSGETNSSILVGFILGIAGIYLLLSLQFKNYREPVIVLINIPLAFIGVIWGHLLMGLDLTMPSMIGFVSLAGVVVNDSILLVEFVKLRSQEGFTLHDAAGQAVRDRFRAIFLTSVTTVAGMLPLLSETSLQAQILVPLVTSVVFGMMTSTLLLLLVLPSAYAILEDFGFAEPK